MMKIKLTNKAVKENFDNLRAEGYCGMQFLLRGCTPVAYTAGIYGWNYDVYEVHGITICTGYRNMPGIRMEHVKEYEHKARRIWEDYRRPYEERSAAVAELLHELCVRNGGY